MIKYTKKDQQRMKEISLRLDEAKEKRLRMEMEREKYIGTEKEKSINMEIEQAYIEIHRLKVEEISVIEAAEQRKFNSYKGNIPAMVEDLKAYIGGFVHDAYKMLSYSNTKVYLSSLDENGELNPLTREDEQKQWIKAAIERGNKIYFDFIREKDPAALEELYQFIEKAIENPAAYSKLRPAPGNINTSFPAHYVRGTDKTVGYTFDGTLTDIPTEIGLESKGRARVTITAAIIYQNLEELKMTLKPHDLETYNAVITLYSANYHYFTPQMLYQIIAGDPDARLTVKKEKEIRKSIEVCASTLLRIKRQEGYYKDLKEEYGGNLLTVKWVTAVLNGNRTYCYQITTPPLLYEYARDIGQVGSCKLSLLNIPVNKSDDVLLIRQILLERIMALKNPNNGNKLHLNEILYSHFYKIVEMDPTATPAAVKKKKTTIRAQAKRILDYWKKEGYINDYSEEMKGRAAHKLTIQV